MLPDYIRIAPGAFVDNVLEPGDGECLTIYDPSYGTALVQLNMATEGQVLAAVEAAGAAQRRWAARSPSERAEWCRLVGEKVRAATRELVDLLVHDAGMPVTLARRDVITTARYFEYNAGLAEHAGGRVIPLGVGALDYTIREPWGVCAIVLPFNFPLQLTARSLAPALIMGNTVVLKAPEQAPFAAIALAHLCAAAGAPPGAVNVVVGEGVPVGRALITHPAVGHVTFTGSIQTGARVMELASKQVKPLILELGGKSPHLIFPDADLPAAVETIVSSTFRTAGQACSAGTRVIVQRAVYDEFLRLLRAALTRLCMGPAEQDPAVGPLISAQQQERVAMAVKAGVASGAKILYRGADLQSATGYFVPPTLLGSDDPTSPAARDEIFGPVATLLVFDDEDHGVELANDGELGLVVGIWTRDVARALRTVSQVRAGQVFVNGYGVGGGVEMPFGGCRRSGFGRLKGLEGALEYTQVKNIWVSVPPLA